MSTEAFDLLSNTPEYRRALEELHASRISDPVYLAGFKSGVDDNPYAFNEDLDLTRMKISLKDVDLTNEEKKELLRLNGEMEATPWMRWFSGHHARLFPFLSIPSSIHLI
jgi:hypothetical protein